MVYWLTTSSDHGTYEFVALAPGIYKMLIQGEGSNWYVFRYNGATGILTPINEVE